jgi:tetratricopeptide (TPR) repeat protein
MIARFVAILFLTLQIPTVGLAQFNTDQVLANARNALYFEDYVLSIQYLNRVINAKPYLAEPYFLRAYAKYSLDDYQGALIDCDKSIDINPFYPDAFNLRGIIKQRMDQYDGAMADFSEGLKIVPDHTHLLTNRANSQLALKEYAGALDDYNKVIAKDPNLVSVYLNRGIAKIHLNDTIGALSDFSFAAEKNPYLAEGFWYRAIVYSQTQQHQLAIADYNKAIDLKPDEPAYYLNRGITRYMLDDLQGAMDDLSKTIDLEPKNRLALLDRGLLRAEVGDLNRAIDDFSRALALDPSDLITIYNRALVYMQLGDYKPALADLNIVIENYPDYGPAYMSRSYVKSMLNDARGAMLDEGTAFKLEMQRRERQPKDDESSNSLAGNQDVSKKKEARTSSDNDIRQHNKVAVLNDFETKEKESDEAFASIRGRIQNRDIFVDLEPLFGVTLTGTDSLSVRVKYYDPDLEQFNRKRIIRPVLQFGNHDENTSAAGINFFNMAVQLTEDMTRGGVNADALFVRSIMFGAVMNFSQALDDLSKSIELEPTNKLALLNRSVIRFKMVEAIRALEAQKMPSEIGLQSRITAKNTPSVTAGGDQLERIIDYDLIIHDLNRIIEIDSRFAFAYFNRGIMMCIRRDFEAGINDFSKAIELNPEFAEAYFNRGLTRIFLKQEQQGVADLSKAGELGLYKAYNVIKRYGGVEKK